MQPKFKDETGREFTPSQLIGTTVAYGAGLGTIRRVIETHCDSWPVMVICHTANGNCDWRLDECIICIGMTTNN